MNKEFYYVVRKQLQEFDEVEETNGWKDVSIYKIENNKPKLIEELEIQISDNSEDSVREFLCENSHIEEDEEITLTQL